MSAQDLFTVSLKKINEVGYVDEVHSNLIRISGLPKVHASEVVVFENGARGYVYSIDELLIDVVLMTDTSVSIGERVARTGESIMVHLSPDLLGKHVNAVGELVGVANTPANSSVKYPVFRSAPPMASRTPIRREFETGIAIVDMTVPLGHGQRELLLGDRKTGKTQFLLQILRNQVQKNSVCIYCAIGKRETEIHEIIELFKDPAYKGAVTVVASSGHEGVGRIFLTPFTAMSIAEYFRDLGRDVFLILDDLSSHAQFYRELALLAKRFPGRSSYPGDIFHVHAELLERAGSFHLSNNKEGTITCIPVAQSVLGDITGYITTNLMSMTDGHLYLDTEIFDEGRRPALNPFLSVTRVGHQTQTPLLRDLSREITSFLTSYRRAQEFSHFGSEVSAEVKETIARGKLVDSFFDQNALVVFPANFAAFILGHIWAGTVKSETPETFKKKISEAATKFTNDAQYRTSIESLASIKDFKTLIGKVQTISL